MFALLPNGGGGKWAPRCPRPFIEWIWVGTVCKIGSRFLLENRAQLRPIEVFARRFERENGQLCSGPEIELCAGLIPDMGNAAPAIPRLRVKRPGFEPGQELLDGCVVDFFRGDALASAPIRKGGNAARQPHIIGDSFQQRRPPWMASRAAPAQG